MEISIERISLHHLAHPTPVKTYTIQGLSGTYQPDVKCTVNEEARTEHHQGHGSLWDLA